MAMNSDKRWNMEDVVNQPVLASWSKEDRRSRWNKEARRRISR